MLQVRCYGEERAGIAWHEEAREPNSEKFRAARAILAGYERLTVDRGSGIDRYPDGAYLSGALAHHNDTLDVAAFIVRVGPLDQVLTITTRWACELEYLSFREG